LENFFYFQVSPRSCSKTLTFLKPNSNCNARERREAFTGFWLESLREKDHLGDPGVDGRIILRWICRKWCVGAWTGSNWFRRGTVEGTCKCSNDPSGSVKCGEFLD
jgi:hypothetical protein